MARLNNANTLILIQLSTFLLLSVWLNVHLMSSVSLKETARDEKASYQSCISAGARMAHLRYRKQERFHVCLRTRDSAEFIEEILVYYFYHGVTSMSVFDDGEDRTTEKIVKRFINQGFDIEYSDVRRPDEARRNENMDLLGCFLDHFQHSTYIMNVDDDEFFFPANTIDPSIRIVDLLEDTNAPCLAMPIYMFGTGGIQGVEPGRGTLDTFVYRDKDFTEADYRIATSRDKLHNRTTQSRVWYMYRFEAQRHTTWVRRRRIQKAVYVVKNVPDKKLYIQELMTTFKTGSLIHGYGMDCVVEDVPLLAVAHYTRGRKDLINRVSNFWNTTAGLRQRFKTKTQQVNYMQQRDRNSQLDERLVKYTRCLKLFRVANHL